MRRRPSYALNALSSTVCDQGQPAHGRAILTPPAVLVAVVLRIVAGGLPTP